MVSDAKKYRHMDGPERRYLHLQEIIPGCLRVLAEVHAPSRQHVLVIFVNGPKVPQMPVERSLIARCSCRYGWHNEVSTVPGVTGNDKMPLSIAGGTPDDLFRSAF
jgi:hypothetical protein